MDEYALDQDLVKCQVQGCRRLADYEGWYRMVDFIGTPTGLVRLVVVCAEHASLLIGYEQHKNDIQADITV